MAKRRGLCGVIVLVASLAAALAGAGRQDQNLDIPWERLDSAAQQRLRDVTELAIFSRDR